MMLPVFVPQLQCTFCQRTSRYESLLQLHAYKIGYGSKDGIEW